MMRALSVIADSFGGLFPPEIFPGSEKPVIDPSASGATQRWPLLGRFVCVVLLFLLAPLPSGAREPQLPQQQQELLVFGMSTALTGPASFLGLNMRVGVEAAFDEKARSGGIKGKRPTLVCLDDGYEPARTAPNMRHLIHDQNVLAIIGNVGTPTAVAAIPIANAGQTAFFGAFTGAGILRKTPPDRYVINYRASYAEEVSAMIEALIGVVGLRPFEIAFFTQRDTYGDAGFAGGIAALKKHGLLDENQIVHSRYERNTLAVENGLADIILADPPPKAVIMVGAYAPCAAFIRLARQSGLKALFLNVSFVGSAPLAKALGKDGDGVIITQVVPHFDAELPIVQQYRSALVAYADDQEKSFSSLEGYIAARILLKALETITGPISRDGIVTALEGLGEFSIGMGEHLHLGPQDHQACHRIWPTVLSNGKAVPYSWSQLAKNAAGGPNG
jgi:branched-chain amino acid transport system substrate-binding protein